VSGFKKCFITKNKKRSKVAIGIMGHSVQGARGAVVCCRKMQPRECTVRGVGVKFD